MARRVFRGLGPGDANALECELFAAAGETIEFRQEKVAIRMALTVNMVNPLY